MKAEFEVAGLKFSLGGYTDSIAAAIQNARSDRLVERIWAHDYRLWKPKSDEISNRLGWLDVATRMQQEIPLLQSFVDAVKADGINRVLLLGMGGSSLAPELFASLFADKNGLKLSVLDSTDPDAVIQREKEHDPSHTLYIVSSKSGGTVETSSFFKYFYNRALAKLGAAKVGKHFVAITDPGSGLTKTAEQFSFRRIFLADPNIGGRYSALSHFGLVPAALVGVDLNLLLSTAEKMAELCKQEDLYANPGALLGLVLGVLALKGRDKATFMLPDEKTSFGDWVEQLIAESTGKEGKGILPVVREPELSENTYGSDRIFILQADSDKTPQIDFDWESNYEIGTQFFLWEFATAVAGYTLAINPFDQPNVESAKAQARFLVQQYQKTGELPKGQTQPIAWSSLRSFIEHSKPGGYIALQAYTKPSKELTNLFQQLRLMLSQSTQLATTLGYGPRFLHSTGQLHKGDSGNGLFIQFVTSLPKDDLPIPNEVGQKASDFSFDLLKRAQALGDAQALRKSGRRVLSFEINGEPAEVMREFLSEASK